MYLGQAIKIQNKAIDRLRDIYRVARTYGYNEDYINRERTSIFGFLPKNFSMMRRDHLYIASKILIEEMFERDIEGVYLYKGNTYSINKETKHHKTTHDIDPKTLHYENEGFAWFWIETGKMYSSNWKKV